MSSQKNDDTFVYSWNEIWLIFFPRINKVVVAFCLEILYNDVPITALRRATEFIQGVNHYPFIYINYFYIFRR